MDAKRTFGRATDRRPLVGWVLAAAVVAASYAAFSASALAADPLPVVSAGYEHTCGVTSKGTWCWGRNDRGQLGTGLVGDAYLPAVLTPFSANARVIAGGGSHTCALTLFDGVWCWGANESGQLGDGSTEDQPLPVKVVGLSSSVVALAAGFRHTCALTAEGAVKCWGSNLHGELGNGDMSHGISRLPADVVTLSSDVKAITAGAYHTCALKIVGTIRSVHCWGDNGFGQIGNGTKDTQYAPVELLGPIHRVVTSIAAGGLHTCAATTSRFVACWGNNVWGQLGTGNTVDSARPVFIDIDDVVLMTAGFGHSCALSNVSGVKCWGHNSEGQLGVGPRVDRHEPVAVTSGVASTTSGAQPTLVSGHDHTCAVMLSGNVDCWGANDYGQIGNDTTEDRVTPTVVRLPGTPGGDIPEEVVRYAPLVYLHPDEEYYPGDPNGFINSASLKWSHAWGSEEKDEDECEDYVLASEGALDPARLGISEESRFPYAHGETASSSSCEASTDPDKVHTTRDHTRPYDDNRIAYDIHPPLVNAILGDPFLKLDGFYLDLPDNDSVRSGSRTADATVYYECDCDNAQKRATYITYWFFYAYDLFEDQFFNKNLQWHEGDWERITVNFDGEGPPAYVTYYGHTDQRSPRWNNVEKDHGHPIVYSARGSHASYEKKGPKGLHFRVKVLGQDLELPQPFWDRVDAGTTQWNTWESLSDVRQEPWYGYGGAWGQVAYGRSITLCIQIPFVCEDYAFLGADYTGPLGPSNYKTDSPTPTNQADQRQADVSGGAAEIGPQAWAQTFTAGITGTIDSVDVFIGGGASGELIVQLRGVTAGGSPARDVLGSGTIPTALVPGEATWVSVPIQPAKITKGTEYAIVALVATTGSNVARADSTYSWYHASNNVYAGGSAFSATDGGSLWSPSAFDLTFETYVTPEAVNAVTLRSFSARRARRNVVVRWRTAAELDVLGFEVYRGAKGRRIKLTRIPVPGQAVGAVHGAAYTLIDRSAPRDGAVPYWLASVGSDGKRAWLGSAMARGGT